MKTIVKQQEAQLRCYQCGSLEITTICHHCGRPMCANHQAIPPGASLFTENREFNHLTLGEWPLTQKEGNHCEHHVHSTLNYRRLLVIPGIILAVIGLFLVLRALLGIIGCLAQLPAAYQVGDFFWAEILRDTTWFIQDPTKLPVYRCYAPILGQSGVPMARAILVLAAGIGTLLAGLWLNKLKVTEEVAGKPADLPISPASSGFVVLETMNVYYKFHGTGDVETSLAGNVEGSIQPAFRFMPADFRRLGEYQAKHHLAGTRNICFQAGFLTLDGPTRITPEEGWGASEASSETYADRYQEDHTNRIWMESEIDLHPYFTGQKGRIDPAWGVQYKYKAWPVKAPWAAEWRNVPVRIIPRLTEKGKSRVLALEVQLNTAFFPALSSRADPKPGAISLDQAFFLERSALLFDPVSMGVPESDGVVELHTDKGKNVYSVEWRGLWEPITSRPVILMQLPEIRFDQEIDPGARVDGEMVFRIPALSSGIQRVNYFSALGGRVRSQEGAPYLPQTLYTRLRVKVSLRMPRLATTQLISLPITRLERDGGPTQARIERIIHALNSSAMNDPTGQIYVRRVVENIPQFSDSDTGQQTRSAWDLSGRYYHLTYPVDYHVVVYGYGDERQGKTSIEITAQSQVEINGVEAAQDRQYLEGTAALLKNIIIQVFESKGQQVSQ